MLRCSMRLPSSPFTNAVLFYLSIILSCFSRSPALFREPIQGKTWILDSRHFRDILPSLIAISIQSFLRPLLVINLRISIMKFLEFTPLDSINLFLNDLNLGERTIKGSLETFSCKHTGLDRKLSLSLEHEILDYLSQSAESDPSSPVEYLSSKSSRKTLIYLVLTLGHMYPDYDFSAVQAHLFFREEEWDNFKQIFDTYLFEAAKEWLVINGGSLLENMAKAIDEVIKLEECEIFSYNPDFDGDPSMEEAAIWSFNFFFYNRKLKRIVSFRCSCLSNLAVDGLPDEEIVVDEGVDDDLFIDMDM